MAIQTGIIRVRGSAADLTYYRDGGEYYVRLKSSLTAKDFWSRQCFEKSRQSCKRFADGNKLASKVYRSLPKEKQVYALFCQLKTAAIHYLKLGLTPEEAYPYILQHAGQQQFVLPNRIKRKKKKKVFPCAISITSQYILVPAKRYYKMSLKMGVEETEKYAAEIFHSLVPPVLRRVTAQEYYVRPLQSNPALLIHQYKKDYAIQTLKQIRPIAPYPPPVNLDHLLAA